MNGQWIIYAIMLAMLGVVFTGVIVSRRYMRSVADFLSAGRTAGRYLVSVSGGIAALGAITVVAYFEMYYNSGFCMKWWEFSHHFFIVLMAVSGWVYYRFRETRAFTLAEFFEKRYSRKFRIFAGIVAFVAGIINFGVFPGIGARFFMHFLGLPHSFAVLGMDVSTMAAIMVILLTLSVYFVLAGGQVAVLITDFIQGIFISVIFVLIFFYFFKTFDQSQIFEALKTAPENASLLNPFKTEQVRHFNFWYFIILIIGLYYGPLAWQGHQGMHCSAKDAHEAKMGQVLGYWRLLPQIIFFLFIPICAFTVLHHADFTAQAAGVNALLKGMGNEMQQSQMLVPMVMKAFLPIGLIGAFAAVMLAAFISTHDTYLHSWATIFIQDVVMPFRKTPLSEKQHIRALRFTIIGIAVFIFFISLYFQQNQYILLFFAVTSAIFAGGAGACIIFGLYWKRGSTAAAWSAMITGAIVSVTGIAVNQMNNDFILDGQHFFGLSIVLSCLVYISVSLLGSSHAFNLDKMLHRGEYAVEEKRTLVQKTPSKGLRMLGIGREFSKGDRWLYFASYAWISTWLLVFVGGTIYYFAHGISDASWLKFWYLFLIIYAVMSVVVVIGFSIGGVSDIKAMLAQLRMCSRDDADDGWVQHEPDDYLSS